MIQKAEQNTSGYLNYLIIDHLKSLNFSSNKEKEEIIQKVSHKIFLIYFILYFISL